MSPKLRALSGPEVVAILSGFGFAQHSQRGSHVKLRRTGPGGERQTMTIPLHGELDKGTLHAIIRQVSRYIPEDQLRSHFYTK